MGADPTGKAIVHPLRWPGSWHLKGTPRLATIHASNPDAEIHLVEAFDALSAAIEAAGPAATADLPRSSSPSAVSFRLVSAMEFLPNPGTAVHYNQWVSLGYAVHNATAGTGYEIWRVWSNKSDKYDEAITRKTWDAIDKAIAASPVKNPIGAGTIFFHALKAGWVNPDIPPPPEDPGAYGKTKPRPRRRNDPKPRQEAPGAPDDDRGECPAANDPTPADEGVGAGPGPSVAPGATPGKKKSSPSQPPTGKKTFNAMTKVMLSPTWRTP